MLTHKQVWEALDKLAARQGLSPSGLAKRAGLDPTSFNKSKRISTGDSARPRWPSTESLAKVLDATGASLEDFAELAAGARARLATGQGLPVVHIKAAAVSAFDDAGTPATSDRAATPVWSDAAWILVVNTNRFAPVYRDGDHLLVDPQARITAGDRVVVRLLNGEAQVMTLDDLSTDQIDLSPLNPLADPLHLKPADVAFMARVVCVQH